MDDVKSDDAPQSVRFGRIHAHAVTFDEAIQRILDRATARKGGFVVTPNVDHVCLAEKNDELCATYSRAVLSLPDGQPLLWMARGFGTPLPAKVSGSDLVLPLCKRAAEEGMSVYLFGATEEVCALAAKRIEAEAPGIRIKGWSCPMYDVNSATNPEFEAALASVRAASPDLLFFAFGSPKQELAMFRYERDYAPSLAIGVGATFDFLAGKVTRAPKWVSRAGLEWLYRLTKEPRRLWRRYLVQDRAIFAIFLKTRKELQQND